MKSCLAAATSLLLGTIPSLAVEPSLEGMGYPFKPATAAIDWQLPSNSLPATLPLLVASPGTFTPQVLSNLVALLEFKDPERARAALRPAWQGERSVFEEPDSRKSLIITPRTGYLYYYSGLAQALPGTPIQAVPSEAEALQRTLDLLNRLGINESDTSHNPETHQLEFSRILGEVGQFDKQAKQVRRTPTMQGIILTRQFGGISFSGLGDCGGVRVAFANNAKIKELAVSWRTLKLDHNAAVVGPNQVIQRIRDGYAVISPPLEFQDLPHIKKLTIQKFRPYYLGLDGAQAQKWVYPYAAFKAVADFGFTNITVTVNCPLLN
jgi:hypothetical protein